MGKAREDTFSRVYARFTCACYEMPVTIYPGGVYKRMKGWPGQRPKASRSNRMLCYYGDRSVQE